MDINVQLCVLLEKKVAKFSQYETLTQELLHCEVDDIDDYITKRGLLANEIDALDEDIQTLCEGGARAELYYRTAMGRVNFAEISPDLQPAFELSQQVRRVIGRIQNGEVQVMERLQGLKSEALGKIRENQNLPKIKKYLVDLGEAPPEGHFTSGKA